jgi:MFS family permease
MPTYLQTAYHLPSEAVFQANSLAILVLAAMNPVWGWIGDRIGLGRALAVGAVLMAGSTWWFFAQLGAAQLGTGSVVPAWLLVAMASGVIGLVPSLAAVVFPTEVRFTGFAFPYNIGAALFAGLTPLALSWSTHAIGGYAAPTLVLVACAVGLALGLWSKRMTFFMRSDGATEHA